MGTCLCRIEGRCLQQTHSMRRCLNGHQVMCILLITKSPLGMFEQSDTIQYKLLRSVSPIDFASDLMVTCLCLLRRKGFRLVWAKVHSTLSPLWYCIFNDKGYWKSSVTSRHASSAYTIKKRGKRKNPVFRDSVLLLSGRCHINSCNSLIRKELQNRVWISGKKINGNPRLK